MSCSFEDLWATSHRALSEQNFELLFQHLSTKIEVDKDELAALRQEVSRLADAVSSLVLELQLRSLGVTDIYHLGGCNEFKSPKHMVGTAK